MKLGYLMKKILVSFLALIFLLSGCGAAHSAGSGTNSADIDSTVIDRTEPNFDASDPVRADFASTDEDMFTSRDKNAGYDASACVSIALNGDSAACDSPSVQISGGIVTVTAEGTYMLSGSLTDGMLIVDAGDKDKVQLVLNGAGILSGSSAALYIRNADKVFVTLADGTENSLSNGGGFTAIDDSNIDAAVFSKEDLSFNGSGRLAVSSPAGHGIVCKDDLVFTGGRYAIEAAGHGLEANDSVRIGAGSLSIQAGKDGIHAENSDNTEKGFIYVSGGELTIGADGDGLSAGAYMQIEGGRFFITSGGGSANAEAHSSDGFMGGFGGRGGLGPFFYSSETETEDNTVSCKGLKAETGLLINGGSFTLDTADDAVHSNASLVVNGGKFEIATGDDGFHADETLTVTGGTINISQSYEGLEALTLEISGGDIRVVATDDGLNAAGGADQIGFGGPMGNDRFGGPGMGGGGNRGGRPGGNGGSGGGSRNGMEDSPGAEGRPDGGPEPDRDMGAEPGMGAEPDREMEADSLSTSASILISGGTIYLEAYGDGIDSNGSLTISGGFITVCGPTRGDTATLDYETSGVITGGTFIGTGASNMAQSFSSSQQGVIAVSAGNQSAGTQIALKDKSGSTLITHAPALDFNVVILSSPDIVTGQEYTLTVGSQAGTFTAK